MTFKDLTDAICGQIKKWMPELKTCESHGGRIDKDEIKRMSGKAPAVYVAVMATGKPKEVGNGEQDVPLTLVAYVVATDKRRLSRADAALNMTQTLIERIYCQKWGFEDKVHSAGTASSKNLYSGKIATKGIALWVVTWQQTVRLGEDMFKSGIPVPKQLYIGFAPETGAEHLDDYKLASDVELP
ncbi:MAG: DUF1834 family protein [Desulfobacterales bacterium]|nr:DUF1834 family protein [Desulfobacterales bacterium]